MVMSHSSSAGWNLIDIQKPEDLEDAVLGAGLAVTQLSGSGLGGSLGFLHYKGGVASTGFLRGRVVLRGPLSEVAPTLGIGLHLAPGSRHWMREYASGSVGVFLPGDVHDAIYTDGSLYAAITLESEVLEQRAAELELVLDRDQLGATGVRKLPLPPHDHRRLLTALAQVHSRGAGAGAADMLLDVLIGHTARVPREPAISARRGGHSRVVRRARDFIETNLTRPISIRDLARAAGTSERTLHRAFVSVLDETPIQFVRRRRLHRIRADLRRGPSTRIALISEKWGISEFGRMAGWYRSIFGESPSETLRVSRATHDSPGCAE
ncbi:MAG: helix-turn-helix domain-containing protein [Pseudomonadales bacterium]